MMGECEARRQGADIAALWARLRTTHRAAQRGQTARASLRKELELTNGKAQDLPAVERAADGDPDKRGDVRAHRANGREPRGWVPSDPVRTRPLPGTGLGGAGQCPLACHSHTRSRHESRRPRKYTLAP